MRTRVLAGCLCLALSIGAAGKTYDDPIAVMTSHEQDSETRLKAGRQAEQRFPNDPRRIAALNQMLWDRGYGSTDRQYAVDQLIKYDEAEFKLKLAHRIVLLQNWDTIEYILKQAVERNWTDMTPMVVRQYARPAKDVPDAQRPERAAIEKLNPGKNVTEVVFAVFANAEAKPDIAEQTAAWELLCRLTPRAELMDLLGKAPSTTAMVADLKTCAAELGTLPTNKEGVLWLSYLRDPSRRAWWESAKSRVASLNAEQRKGLELRHLPVLLHAEASLLSKDRAALLGGLRERVQGGEHYLLAPIYDGQPQDYPQRLAEVADQLCWGDLVVMTGLLDSLNDPAVRTALLDQAEHDKTDTGSEHGGALTYDDSGRLVVKEFPARVRTHDLKFISSPELVEAVYTGAAHYHFHAQEHRNSDHAGPGRGDLAFATRLNFNCMVFTFITKEKLNADYYQPGGVVVDLGVVTK
ncbi:MAG: hypothetical protein K8S99_11145 [Planctomycetes bacterium]|nr:hypothetical protein [Planctomycetota bacterium]